MSQTGVRLIVSSAATSLVLALGCLLGLPGAEAAGRIPSLEPAGGPQNTGLPSAGPLSGWSGWLEGQIFTATTGSWTGAEPISFGYQWERCNAAGSACTNISGATASTFTPTSEDVGATLRVIITAKNSEGTTQATSPAGDVIAAQAAPEAHVVNGSGEVVQSYGETYAGGPGGQIQLAENFAHAHEDTKVTLGSGTFKLYSSSMQELPDLSVAIIAYSNIQLEGAGPSSEIALEALGRAEGLDAVMGVFAEPDGTPLEEDGLFPQNLSGTTLDVSNFAINVAYEAAVGLDIGPEHGPGLAVHNITVSNVRDPSKTNVGTGIEVGDPQGWSFGGPVSGTAESPVQVTGNEVRNTWADGIAVTGKEVNVASNRVYWARSAGSNAITVDSETPSGSSDIDINNNRMENDHTGIGLDGSGHGGYSDSIQSNAVIDTCIGIDLNVQTGAYVGNNIDYLEGGFNPETVTNPYTGESGLNCGVPGEFSSIGVLVQNSPGNYVYGNYLDKWGIGVLLLWDGQLSKEFFGSGTQYNGVGLYYDPETKSNVYDGNRILLGGEPIVVEDREDNELANWNAIFDNETEDSTGGCHYEHLDEEYVGDNTGAGCEQTS